MHRLQVRKSFDLDHETITQLAEKEEPGCSGVNFLPYITGKQLPHKPGDLLRGRAVPRISMLRSITCNLLLAQTLQSHYRQDLPIAAHLGKGWGLAWLQGA